ncbi:hypothetical protein PYW07_015861 [Mythimna separata]|uniref:LITAF domain-containing protein n=1 Tax=Mythimna separata TaxID=271217 RepID=A0AAD8DVN0_MYTSE|nr:hypothetical protein PYW07_015861 [Mythimna separata]
MEQNSDVINDPKGQGRPPPYSMDPPPPVTVTTHTSHTYPPQPVQPPPVHGMVYQAGPGGVPVIVNHHPMTGTQSTPITCKSCNELIATRVELKTSTKTHLFALLICCVFWPLACLPYCIDSCHNADHYCPNCNAYIGSYTS